MTDGQILDPGYAVRCAETASRIHGDNPRKRLIRTTRPTGEHVDFTLHVGDREVEVELIVSGAWQREFAAMREMPAEGGFYEITGIWLVNRLGEEITYRWLGGELGKYDQDLLQDQVSA